MGLCICKSNRSDLFVCRGVDCTKSKSNIVQVKVFCSIKVACAGSEVAVIQKNKYVQEKKKNKLKY